jgi:hypothetical protein
MIDFTLDFVPNKKRIKHYYFSSPSTRSKDWATDIRNITTSKFGITMLFIQGVAMMRTDDAC